MKPVDHSEEMALRRIARGAVHTLSSAYAGRFVNWVAIFILTRELAPEDFGHVALAASLLAFVISLRSFGLHNALLHQYNRVDQVAPTHFILNTCISALGTLAAIGLAVLFVDDQYGRSVATILGVFAVFDFLRATVLTAETQLRRDLEFGSLAGAHGLALIVAAAAGIAMVYLDGGIWALILSHSIYGIGYVVVYCALVWRRRSPFRFRLADFDLGEARRLFRYGVWIWIGGIFQTFLLNFDRLVAGSLLGDSTLGFYDRAHIFAQLPTGVLTHALIGILVAVFARYHQDQQQLSGAFRRTLRWILRCAVPLSVLLAIEIPAIIRLLLGEDWLPMAHILRCLLLYSVCRPVLEAVHTLLRSIGDPRGFAALVAIQASVLLVAAPMLTRAFAIEGTAVAMSLTGFVGTILGLWRSTRYVEVPWMRSFLPPLLSAAVASALRLHADPFVEGLSTPAALIMGIALFIVTYGAALLVLERRTLLNELRTLRAVLQKKQLP